MGREPHATTEKICKHLHFYYISYFPPETTCKVSGKSPFEINAHFTPLLSIVEKICIVGALSFTHFLHFFYIFASHTPILPVKNI